MGEDTSIDEFAATTDDGEADDGTDGIENRTAAAGGESVDSTADTSGHDAGADTESVFDNVAPTVTTYGWTPRNVTCDACGESTKQRWRDDGAMVCRECKEW